MVPIVGKSISVAVAENEHNKTLRIRMIENSKDDRFFKITRSFVIGCPAGTIDLIFFHPPRLLYNRYMACVNTYHRKILHNSTLCIVCNIHKKSTIY